MVSNTFDQNSLHCQLVSHFTSFKNAEIQFLVAGQHINFLVTNGESRYLLRAYRDAWRSKEEIKYELDLLLYLQSKLDCIAPPVESDQGQMCFPLTSISGTTTAALFDYIDASAPLRDLNVKHARLLGKSLARLHTAAEKFQAHFKRQVLDIDYLLDQSIQTILPYLTKPQRQYLLAIQADIQKSLPEIPQHAPYFTICHGDPNAGNFLIDSQEHLTFIDFDQCGPGWRIFDIGKFLASVHWHDDFAEIRRNCLEAYHCTSELINAEQTALPYMTQIAAIWVAAIQVYNKDLVGAPLLSSDYWQQRLDTITKLRELFAG